MKKLIEIRTDSNRMLLVLGRCVAGSYDHRLIRFPVEQYKEDSLCMRPLEAQPADQSNISVFAQTPYGMGIAKYLGNEAVSQGYVFLDPETGTPAAVCWLFFCGAEEAEYTVRGGGEAALISDIYVFEAYRGQRIVSQLLHYAFRVCRERGVKDLYASVRKNNEAAWRAYGRVGFEDAGERKFVRILGHNFPKQYIP